MCESMNMKGFVMEEQNNRKLHDAILVEKVCDQTELHLNFIPLVLE